MSATLPLQQRDAILESLKMSSGTLIIDGELRHDNLYYNVQGIGINSIQAEGDIPMEDLYFFDPSHLYKAFMSSDIAITMHFGMAEYLDFRRRRSET
jgi:hypothetical protein